MKSKEMDACEQQQFNSAHYCEKTSFPEITGACRCHCLKKTQSFERSTLVTEGTLKKNHRFEVNTLFTFVDLTEDERTEHMQ